MEYNLIAPCGMNCGLCSGYLAYRHQIPMQKGKITHCVGCRPRNKQCAFIKRNCESLRNNRIEFCFECRQFPCDNLKHLDNQYRNKYATSFIENLQEIRDSGIDEFLIDQHRNHRCSRCDGVICIHNEKCYECDRIESWKG